jgi:hypothetical protein
MEAETITATGASGAKYAFYVYPWGTDLKPVGGVYMVLRKGFQNGKYDALYVGQTGNLSERFDNHHRKPCFDSNRKTHIAAMIEQSQVRRFTVEADLIRNYKTSCNL